MAVFKIERCPACNYRHFEPKPKKTPRKCPRCGSRMSYTKNWYISWQIYGRKYIRSIGPSKTAAVAALGKIKAEIEEGRFLQRLPETPWHEAVEMFRQWFRTNKKPKTQQMYENSLNVLSEYFGHLTLNQITPSMVEDFKARRAKDTRPVRKGKETIYVPISPATINRDLATLKRLFSLAEDWGLVSTNKIHRIKLLKENNKRLRFLTDQEIDALLQACDSPHLRLAVRIALETGLRKDAILTLRWSEVDFKNHMIHKKTKGDKTVHIPMTELLEKELKAWKQFHKVLSPYVITYKGQPVKDIKRSFATACRKAGIEDFRFHDLRHTFASHFLMRTKDLKTLQEILGHSDITTTMRYAHLLDEHKKEAMKRFEEKRKTGT